MDINQAGIPLGWHMLPKMDSVGSTNTWLKEHAADLPSIDERPALPAPRIDW